MKQSLILHAMTLTSLIYVSSAQVPFSKPELTSLLATSRRNNERSDVTGLLVYRDGNFMQVIEGEDETVQALHDKIQRDSRHGGLITLLKQRITERQFPSWSMGFRDLADPDLRTLPGYNEFLNTPLDAGEFLAHPSRAQKLLLGFKQRS